MNLERKYKNLERRFNSIKQENELLKERNSELINLVDELRTENENYKSIISSVEEVRATLFKEIDKAKQNQKKYEKATEDIRKMKEKYTKKFSNLLFRFRLRK